jgi:hypothetical protein
MISLFERQIRIVRRSFASDAIRRAYHIPHEPEPWIGRSTRDNELSNRHAAGRRTVRNVRFEAPVAFNTNSGSKF